MVLFRITENEPSKMHNVRPYVYSRPCVFHWSVLFLDLINRFLTITDGIKERINKLNCFAYKSYENTLLFATRLNIPVLI